MKVLELFSGSAIFSKAAREREYKTLTVDNNPKYDADICTDILTADFGKPSEKIDVIWASPPCQTFSVASISKHWKGGKRAYVPKSKEARIGLKLLKKTIQIIQEVNPKYWFIENPRCVTRKVLEPMLIETGIPFVRQTISYCQYGDSRMKPTDIWTNCFTWKPRTICKNGDDCHEAAPRGSRTGTQGLKNAFERGILPKQLCKEILGEVSK